MADLYTPAGTTRLLGLQFDGGSLTKTGTYTVTTTGSLTFPTTGGVLNTGHATGWGVASNYLRVTDLVTVSTNYSKTYCAWYKGTQLNSGGVETYSPSVPIFSDISTSVYWGLGISAGKICVANGTLNVGTTLVNTNQWVFLTWVVKSNYKVDAYVNGVKELTDITVNSIYPGTSYIGTGYPYAGTASPTALDLIQIFNGELTQSQILEIYNTPEVGTAPLIEGIFASANVIFKGQSVTVTFNSNTVQSGNVPYTISGVTTEFINNSALTGNFVISNNTGNITITTKTDGTANIFVMNISANVYSTSVSVYPAFSYNLEDFLGSSYSGVVTANTEFLSAPNSEFSITTFSSQNLEDFLTPNFDQRITSLSTFIATGADENSIDYSGGVTTTSTQSWYQS
jgi:hypothetical protein